MDKKIKIGVIGGGSVGLFACNILIEKLEHVCIDIIEKNSQVGKKILATGNGKCNFTNKKIDYSNYNNEKFARDVIENFDNNKTLQYFSKLGLVYKFDEEGRAYPHSESATSVLDILTYNLLNKVNYLTNCKVKKIVCENDKIKVFFNKTFIEYDYIIIASGNIASNLANFDDNDYLKSLKLIENKLKPSLTSFKTFESFEKVVGLRAKCDVSLFCDNKLIKKEFGEIIFKKHGIGGIVILQMSHFYNKNKTEDSFLKIDFVPQMSVSDLNFYFDTKKHWFVKDLFLGLLNEKLSFFLLKQLGLHNRHVIVNDMESKIKEKLFKILKEFEVKIKSTEDFIFAQVVSGGIDVDQVNENLQLKKAQQIYLGGEVLDIDGICGGYNLQFAWSSAKVIADSIINIIKK